MSWIAEYDTQGREFPTCVHVTKTTGTMTHGATYVPIEDGKAVRAENAKLVSILHEVEAEAVNAYLCLQHDCELLTAELEDRFRKYWHEQCENAKLRDEQREYQATIDSLVDECTDHKAENAKLRDLVRDMWDFYCVMPDEPHAFKEELDFSAEVWKRMRELGVNE